MVKTEQKSAVNVVFGSMTFGREGAGQARVHDLETAGKILDVFQRHGHYEVDTARVYCGGSCEEMLGDLGWQKRGLQMDTKLYPTARSPVNMGWTDVITHSPEDIRKNFDNSLKALKADRVDAFYLHAPDRETPYEETLRAVNEIHKEGKFDRFGISNYAAHEVAEMVMICRQHGWIQPTMFQVIYNALHRAIEPELVPCCRKFGLGLFCFNPLGGGFLSGKMSKEAAVEAGSRFDPEKAQGKSYRARYWHDQMFEAVEQLKEIGKKHDLTVPEIALRWMTHHSVLKREHGDAVIIGASSLAHIEQNLLDLEKPALPEEVVKAVDAAYAVAKPSNSKYFH
ncbi:uncharacterized protein L969DRAFT_53573 [Mixia osmundae IAM 14324]|uniref:NADP-dependent oxidoreductase domain-containing protein n=1 Tax=Mixia osmundae (strain CBS 9802 / IAM 14324 / JCM 22182 / KY 12970) TaxID=764103 RepID=G7EB09_MIXOS|nr:uncharacterized protein L969DRAFT_53573 [Mixia osmundae IAM 14324]KEI37054.1 hypothetical protein L969DRAFT_53573 [Mixia osmundae IAM 14324]GAB00020.1 hypothetical protein E5Q_06722 [Mixia osmundae IAM 14324]